MKLKTQYFLFLTILFFISACQKEDTPNYDRVSGTLLAGKNVTSADLSKLQVFLWQVNDSIDLKKIDALNLPASAFLDSMTINQDGLFSFDNLPNGKYFITISEGYLLGSETISAFVVDGKTSNIFNSSVQKIVPENGVVYTYPLSKIKAGSKIVRHKFEINLRADGSGCYLVEISEFNIEENGIVLYNIYVPYYPTTIDDQGWTFEADLDETKTIGATFQFRYTDGKKHVVYWNSLNGDKDSFKFGDPAYMNVLTTTLTRYVNTRILIYHAGLSLSFN
jgi:hypothetical protein